MMTQFECVKRGETGGQGIGEGVTEVKGGMGGRNETDAMESETQKRGQGRTVFLDSP